MKNVECRLALGRALLAVALGYYAIPPASVQAGDWPQILGPERSGVATDEKLATRWPAGGPKKLWSKSIGMGYASAVVAGDNVIVFHRENSKEILQSLHTNGAERWKRSFPAYYRGGVNSDLGPRCTPVIDGNDVFAYGAAGDLYCVDLATGKPRWTRSLYEDYEASPGFFGAGSAPLVVDDRVLVNVGGKGKDGQGAGLVALDRKTGRTLWAKTNEGASYAAPIQLTYQQQPAALFVARLNAVAVRPADGKELFRFPFGKRGPTVNAATPVLADDLLFFTASYGIGGEMRRLTKDGLKTVWENDRSLSSQFATPVFHNAYLYGSHGREDIGQAELRCVEARSGKVQWSQPMGVAHVIRSGDLLLVQTTLGELKLLRANPKRFELLAAAEVATEPTKALPALADGRLYVRVTDEDDSKLMCFEVGATQGVVD